MSRPTLTQARVQQLAGEINSCGRFARETDPTTQGVISYPAMLGGLQATLIGLVRDLAGQAAADKIDRALIDATASSRVPV